MAYSDLFSTRRLTRREGGGQSRLRLEFFMLYGRTETERRRTREIEMVWGVRCEVTCRTRWSCPEPPPVGWQGGWGRASCSPGSWNISLAGSKHSPHSPASLWSPGRTWTVGTSPCPSWPSCTWHLVAWWGSGREFFSASWRRGQRSSWPSWWCSQRRRPACSSRWWEELPGWKCLSR